MTKKIKAIDINPETTTDEPIVEVKVEIPKTNEQEDTVNEITTKVEEHPLDKLTEEESKGKIVKADGSDNLSPPNDESEQPKPDTRKRITCPDCGKTMLERNFRYQHLKVCGKVKTPVLRAKPIEEVIKEKQEQKAKSEPKPVEVVRHTEVIQAVEPPTYMELRRQYNNKLKEQKQQLVKKLISKAF
jgi:ssDNA-binding Zn-finger/Zn-ribbon topoisomerase 1